MRAGGISLAISRIDLQNALHPRRLHFVIQPIDGSQHCHTVEGFAGNRYRFLRFLRGELGVAIFERQIGQQFVRLI